MTHFRMPAEWEPQSAIWTSWPHNLETWPENLNEAQAEWIGLVRLIAQTESVSVLVPPREMETLQSQLGAMANIQLLPIETNDAWARDYAPTFVHDQQTSELVAIDWYYNAWGEKYPPFDSDQQVAKRVADALQVRHFAGGLCAEGGAIEISELGVLLTTRSCLLNSNRNPGVRASDVERLLKNRLGCEQVVWLPGDFSGSPTIVGDDTDAHIDQIARFVDNEKIVHAWVTAADPRRESLAANVESLAEQLPEVKLVPLMLPSPFRYCGRDIPASYCNFLICNEVVIVPQFGVPEDAAALETLGSLFGEREVLPLDSRNLSVGLGSFHCLTQQQPKVCRI